VGLRSSIACVRSLSAEAVVRGGLSCRLCDKEPPRSRGDERIIFSDCDVGGGLLSLAVNARRVDFPTPHAAQPKCLSIDRCTLQVTSRDRSM